MRKIACALALLLLLPILAAGVVQNPQLASASSIEILQQGQVSTVGGGMKSIIMNISVPRQSEYQLVESGQGTMLDGEGNPFLHITDSAPSNPFTYSHVVRVAVSSRSTTSLPESYAVPPSLSKYTSPSAMTQSDNAEIRETALRITEGSADPFEKVARLAIFVNQNTAYNDSMVGLQKDALWVLQNRQGVCAEYSTLFAALSRSIGIPTRYISGYVYSDRFGSWVGHAWNEVYIGQWVPVDSTWFEVGRLDALHVEEARQAEFTDRNTVSATVSSPNTEIQWDTPGKSGATASNVYTREVNYSRAETAFDLGAVAGTLPQGGMTVVYLTINGKDYSSFPVLLANCEGRDLVSISNPMQFAILRPGEATTLSWLVTVSGPLDSDFTYTCPLTLNSPYLEHRVVTLKIDPELVAQPDFIAEVESRVSSPGATNNVILSLPQSRRGKEYFVFAGGRKYSSNAVDAVSSIPFIVSGSGSQTVYVAAQGGGAKALEFESMKEKSKVSIDSLAVPPLVPTGRQANATARISASHYPADLTLLFTFCGQQYPSSARISSRSDVSFGFTPQSPGICAAKLTASEAGSGAGTEKNAASEVFAAPSFRIDRVESSNSKGGVLALLSLSFEGDVISPTVTINGKERAAEESISIPLSPGDYSAALAWGDRAGNRYSATQEFTVLPPGMFGGPCPIPLAALAFCGLFPFILKR